MILLFDFCSIPWWLTWLLPFLIGLAIGWLLWARYKGMVADLEAKVSMLEGKIKGLEADLDACKKMRMEAEGNVSLFRGRMREMEANLANAVTAAPVAASPVTASASIAATPVAMPTPAPSTGSVDKIFAAVGTDRLQIVEGIGPKMDEILRENGINTFAALSSSSKDALRDILNKYGDKYRIIDPNTWPQQAGLAQDRKWNELIDLQKALDTGRSDTATSTPTDSKLEKYLIKVGVLRRWAQDDLKAVEGIGPKIEELLHAAGIKTWRALSTTDVAAIQDVLTAAGPRFQLADPGTWPKQAELAADGKWDELQEYQDFLQAGKEK